MDRAGERWALVLPVQLAVDNGYARDVAPILCASAALAHDRDLLQALLRSMACCPQASPPHAPA